MYAYLTGTRLEPQLVLTYPYDATHAATGEPLRDWVKTFRERHWDNTSKTWTVAAFGDDPAATLAAAGFVAIGPDDRLLNLADYTDPVATPDSRDAYVAVYPRLRGREAIALDLPADADWRDSENRWLIPADSFRAWLRDTTVAVDTSALPDVDATDDGTASTLDFDREPFSPADVLATPAYPRIALVPDDTLAYDGSLDGLRGVPVTDLDGVTRLARESMAAVGIDTVWDLLHYTPRRYIDLSAPELATDSAVGEKVAILGTVVGVHVGDGRRPSKVNVRDAAGTVVSCVWFNADWIVRKFAKGQRVIIFGKLTAWEGRSGTGYQMANPLVSVMDADTTNAASVASGDGGTGAGLIPVYPASAKAELNTWQVHRAASEAVAKLGELADPVPVALTEKRQLVRRRDAYRAMHAPSTPAEADAGRRRLAYDELLRLQLTLLTTRAAEIGGGGVPHRPTGALLDRLVASLPFPLTGAQQRALADVRADLLPRAPTRSKLLPRRPMNRLLQGDVGVGKTLVAVAALLMAVEGDYQSVLMAPTEILASQHYAEVVERLAGMPVRVELLTNKVTGKRRKEALAGLADGSVHVVVGTHALLADTVTFHRLGMVVIDEQHRFGVEQRAALRTKGPAVDGIACAPDVLMATATPIPRTAVMTVFGDMECSVLDELPPGRTPIQTTWVESGEAGTSDPDAAPWRKIREQVAQGRQAFVVCPLVSDSETKAATAATTAAEELAAGALRGMRIGVVHGKQKPGERAEIMGAFVAGQLDVLVATTVIEVGVNVPNATVMAVLGAEMFGLSQLHQIRGRVGRGKHPGFCVLIGSPKTEDGKARLAAMCETTDGFRLSEIDLGIRGFGTLLGGSQSGTPTDFRVADILTDTDLVAWAKEDALTLTDGDPHLARRPQLRDEIKRAVGNEAAEWLTSA